MRKQALAIIKARPKPGAALHGGDEAADGTATSGGGSAFGGTVDDARASAATAETAEEPDERSLNEVMSDVVADMLLTSDPMGNSAAAGS